MDPENRNPSKVHLVSSPDSAEFTRLTRVLTRSSLIALDAEWKPIRTPQRQSSFPTVSLLQLACQLVGDSDESESEECVVFLLDLVSIPLTSIWELLRDVFVSPDILKLGFRFKQDLVYLSSTFSSNGSNPGFDKVEPFLDITSVYNHLQRKEPGRKMSKDIKSLATICKEVLGISLSKELQCSDWSQRPLTEAQKTYAAMDAQCLLDIFNVFQAKVNKEGNLFHNLADRDSPNSNLGLKDILVEDDMCNKIMRIKFSEALDIVRATASSEVSQKIAAEEGIILRSQQRCTLPMDASLLKVVKKYGEKILLKESDKNPKASKRKGKKRSSAGFIRKENQLENFEEWRGPPPWDLSLGGNGSPKFLCDVMIRCSQHSSVTEQWKSFSVGGFLGMELLRIFAVFIWSFIGHVFHSKWEANGTLTQVEGELIDQACRENRVLLTRDAKLLRHEYIIKNQIYRVKSLLKNEQLLEVIQTYDLKISEDQLMSRCTKCNGRFIQKPLTTEEAVEAAKGFQRIPNCLFDKNLEFWQCMDCNQLYWEGTQYRNAVQKFIDVCKLND